MLSITKRPDTWWYLEDWLSKNAKSYFGSDKYLKAERCLRDRLVSTIKSSKMGSIEGAVADGKKTTYLVTFVEEHALVTATCSCSIDEIAKTATTSAAKKATTTSARSTNRTIAKEEEVAIQEEGDEDTNTPSSTPQPCHHIAAFLMSVSDPKGMGVFGDDREPFRTFRYGTIPDWPFSMRGNLLAAFRMVPSRFYATNLREMMKIELPNLGPYFKSHPEFMLFTFRRIIDAIYDSFKVVVEEGERPVPVGSQFDDSYFTKACFDFVLCQPTTSHGPLYLLNNILLYSRNDASTSTHSIGWGDELKRRSNEDESFKEFRRNWDMEGLASLEEAAVTRPKENSSSVIASSNESSLIHHKLQNVSLPLTDVKKCLEEYVALGEHKKAITWLDGKLGRSGPEDASLTEGEFLEFIRYRASLAKQFQDEAAEFECVREGMRWVSGESSKSYLEEALKTLPNKINELWKLYAEFNPAEYAALMDAERVTDERAAAPLASPSLGAAIKGRDKS